MNKKFTLLLVLLLIPTISFNSAETSLDDNHGLPPAPIFDNLDNTGTPDGSYVYASNTTVKIQYKADRFQVDGLILLGEGSNLTTDLNNPDYLVNFTKASSFQGNSIYVADLNISSYTYFYAYAWSGSLNNGTMEELDLFGNVPGHELWIDDGKFYPSFSSASNTRERDDDLYLALNQNTTITYQVDNPENETAEYLTLVMAENETALYDDSMSTFFNMTRTNYTDGDPSYSTFEFEYNMTTPITFFTAFNNRGWERSDGTTELFHRLYNGFSFNITFSEQNINLYTNLDTVAWNITTYNQTDTMSVGYQYRYFENASSDVALLNWTTVGNLVNNTNDSYLNSSIDGNLAINSTRKSTYGASLTENFNVSNVLEIKSFVTYGLGTNITSETTRIGIIDPNPIVTINSKNGTMTRGVGALVKFSIISPKGDLESVSMEQILPDNSLKTTFDILNNVNQSIQFQISTTNTTILDGNHTLIINATNSLGQSTVKSIVYIVDRTNPRGTLTKVEPTGPVSTGRVVFSFTAEDVGPIGTGVKYVTLDWGNNVTINVTSLSQASHTYRRSGSFTITLTVYDKVGNSFEVDEAISVSIERIETSETRQSPFPMVSVTLFLGLIVYSRHMRNKKYSSYHS